MFLPGRVLSTISCLQVCSSYSLTVTICDSPTTFKMTSDQESSDEESVLFKSRPYQDEILKKCIQQNTIIYLPTGAGKTFIAIMAMKHFAKDLEKPISEGGKRSVFLTNTKALADQQAEVIKKLTPLRVGVYTSDEDVDTWEGEQWFDEFERNQVIVATAQVVLDVITFGFLKISNINLIIFDECHHASKKHPMLLLMETFQNCPIQDHPRVIGLTGMLTKESIKPKDIKKDLERLESTLRGAIVTAKSDAIDEVRLYCTDPEEATILYKENVLNNFSECILQRVQSMLERIEISSLNSTTDFDRFKTICNDFKFQIQNLGLYGATLANLAAIVDMELRKREANTIDAEWLARTLITSLEETLHINMRKLYNEENIQTDDTSVLQTMKEDSATILENSSSQVQELLLNLEELAEDYENKNQTIKGLIFVKRRCTARILCHIVRRYAKTCPNLDLSVDFMTGQNAYMLDSIENLTRKKNNNRVLDKFKRNEINLIITTNVLEEGIDLQECNLVICYDTPKTFRSYVQRKGRARMKQSEYVIMTLDSERNRHDDNVDEWQENIRILEEILIHKAVDRELPQQDDIDAAVKQEYNEKFFNGTGTVDYNSAVKLVNMYCMRLPRDRFTASAAQYEEHCVEDGYSVSLLLPIQSPLKEIITGEILPSLRDAKASAAFKAIKKLYQLGELNEHFLPINRETCLEKYKDVYFSKWNQFNDDNPKEAGTEKNKRMHDIQIPAAFIVSMPRVNTQLYLYEIEMKPEFQARSESLDANDENIKIFHQLLQSKRSYGILTTKPLPRMGLMKFFQSFGQIACSVTHEPRIITLSNPQKLAELKRFHCILFRNVLDIWKEFFVYDHKNSVVIVPTNNHQIDWSIVEQFQTWSDVKPKTVNERMNTEYKKEDWLYSVICPWYRQHNEDVRYVVTQIESNKTPLSPFPNDTYENFADYMRNTYTEIIDVVNNDQFLIGVKPLTTRLNRLHPGDGEDGGRRNQRPKIRGQEFLIPELCHNFHYPGDLWLKAINLPSVLHRITYILHAEELRVKINECVGLEDQIIDYNPQPLIDTMMKKSKESESNNGLVDEREPKSTIVSCFGTSITVLGPELHEPMDLERDFDKAFKIDIDYVYKFNKRRLSELSGNKNKYNNLFPSDRFHTPVPALCEAPAEDKLHINILEKKLSTPNTRGIEQHELLAALTSASSADVFHMELLEVLGDAYLKFSVSLYLIQKHINWHEGNLTTIKGQIVGNRNLCYAAIRHNLPGMIKIQPFNPKFDWQPPMLKVEDGIQECMKGSGIKPNLLDVLKLSKDELESGEVSDENLVSFLQMFSDEANVGREDSSIQTFLGRQRVSDKTCADCVEAILGACVKSLGVERSFKVLELLGILPTRDDVDISKMLLTKLNSPRIRTNISNIEVDSFLVNHEIVENAIGYKFKDRAYLLQALTHPSYPTNRVTGCYQQLEFLGDAVLDILVTVYIFERCPQMDPGQLTNLRSALVNNVTLACLCVRYKIHLHILSQSSFLSSAIEEFVNIQCNYNHEVGDHVIQLVAPDMAEYVDVPKALGDVFEAIIGGIFLDSGNDLEMTWKVIYRLMEKELDKFMKDVPRQVVQELYEFPNAKPEFEKVAVVDKDQGTVLVKLWFTRKGERQAVFGRSTNKKNAERAAAKIALIKLKS